jgi:hypothetical protein
VRLKPAVLAGLEAHGIVPGPGEDAAALRERLNDAYLEDVRRLRRRRQAGEIPPREYAAHVEALKQGYPLLGLPIRLWEE